MKRGASIHEVWWVVFCIYSFIHSFILISSVGELFCLSSKSKYITTTHHHRERPSLIVHFISHRNATAGIRDDPQLWTDKKSTLHSQLLNARSTALKEGVCTLSVPCQSTSSSSFDRQSFWHDFWHHRFSFSCFVLFVDDGDRQRQTQGKKETCNVISCLLFSSLLSIHIVWLMSSTPLTLFHSTCLHTHTASWGTNLERHSCLRQEVTNPARCGIQVPSISVAAIAVNNVYRISSPQINNFIHWSVWSILARGTALYTGRGSPAILYLSILPLSSRNSQVYQQDLRFQILGPPSELIGSQRWQPPAIISRLWMCTRVAGHHLYSADWSLIKW